ncbi:hypothetical protein A3A66_00175 [Microgenomates group bacterium RIFCSPLOWO2_01_FULL_46_13]|nr:MAG: hypothetical protein A2783_03455 [Microgenomates group bacterium RIFCSPHIGHO2_01_FULL_45_11]OGV94435.1 MAG: hypothetical protein A3A66_00175 [Microgenomates group bacterium RIFCSPLOWO2_01_FULL_46_13]
MIDFRNVTKTFGNDIIALNEVSFQVEPGEFLFITGPSGAGKTTVGRLLIREFAPTSGEITVGEYDLAKLTGRDIPFYRRQVGFVFQDFKLLPDRTVAENIELSLEILDKTSEEIREKVARVLELVNLSGKDNLFPSQLSGGEVQRTVIARAVAAEPPLIFADEPTGNLDAETGWQITELLEKINQRGTTVIMATHNQGIIGAAKKRVIKLEGGRVVVDTKEEKQEALRQSSGQARIKNQEKFEKEGEKEREENSEGDDREKKHEKEHKGKHHQKKKAVEVEKVE